MDDWRQYTSSLPTGLTHEEMNLEASAEALIARLEGFGDRPKASGGGGGGRDRFTNDDNDDSSSSQPPDASMPAAASAARRIQPPSARLKLTAAPNRRASVGSDADSENNYGQTSQVSEASSTTSSNSRGARAAAHRQEQVRRQQQLMHNRHREGGDDFCTGKPQIDGRSAKLAGERSGDVGDRLLQAGKESAARKQAAMDEAARKAAEEALEARDMVPEINAVSHMLTAHREGSVSDRLYSHSKDHEKRLADKALEERRKAASGAKPAISSGSEQLVARMPGRDVAVQDRLYAEHVSRCRACLATQPHDARCAMRCVMPAARDAPCPFLPPSAADGLFASCACGDAPLRCPPRPAGGASAEAPDEEQRGTQRRGRGQAQHMRGLAAPGREGQRGHPARGPAGQ